MACSSVPMPTFRPPGTGGSRHRSLAAGKPARGGGFQSARGNTALLPLPTAARQVPSLSALKGGEGIYRPRLLPPAVHPVVDEVVDDGRVSQCRDIAQLGVLVGGDLAQNAAHDLAGAGLR